MQKIESNLDLCKSARKIAAKSLATILKKVLLSKQKVSEFQFRDLWFVELKKNSEIYPEGWYTPPPHGIGILFAKDENPERISFTTLRKEQY